MSENTNHILPQSLTSPTSFSLTCTRRLLMLTVGTLKGLPGERAPTIKSTRAFKSQISD